jgi:phage N-6-adenine-methyltransferase
LGEDGSVHRVLVPGEPYPEELDSIPYVQFEERALVFREDTPFEVWSEVVGRLKSAEKSIQWWIGDALRFGERKYGEMYSQALEATDFSYGTLANAAYVAGKIESSRRRENLPFSHHQAVAALEPEEQDVLLDAAAPAPGEEKPRMSRNELREKAREVKALPPEKAVHFLSDSSEWYTPPHVLAMVEEALGAIDLDPCADPGKSVPASAHLTREDDGLGVEWAGRVYMNPPYGTEIGAWVEKLATSYESGDVTAAVALVPARTDTAWFHRLRDYPRLFVRGRLRFSGHDNSAPFPSAAFYLGPDPKRFAAAFASLGDVFARVS